MKAAPAPMVTGAGMIEGIMVMIVTMIVVLTA
jgi:hypothetical protein